MNYSPELISSSFRMLAALVIVLGGLLVFYAVVKRRFKSSLPGSRKDLIRVLSSSYLGVKKNISLVEIPGAILILGITGERITLLTKIEDEDLIGEIKNFTKDKPLASFSDQLHRFSSKIMPTKK